MKKRCFVIFVFFVYGFYFNFLNIGAADDVSREQDTRLKIVESVLESSLLDLRKSAREVERRNQFLLGENKNLAGKVQELEKELKPLQGKKAQLSTSDEGPSATPAYQKLQASSLQEQITRLLKEKDLLGQENRKSEEEKKIKQEKFEESRESNSDKVEEKNALRQKLHSLKTQKEPSLAKELSQEKKRLLSFIEEKKEKIEKLQRKKQKSGSKKDYSSSKGRDHLREKQSQLQEEVSKLERGLSVISGDERQNLNWLQKIEQSRNAQLVQFNQEIDSLTLRKQELERTLAAVQEKLKASPINLLSENQPLEPLEEKLNSLERENQALKGQIPSLEEVQ